ncbi:Tetraspanin family-domain-containing protein, partial [Multifurca ochricompacta]
WTLHKWCLLGSVTTVFLLGLTCLIYSILTWFTAYPTAPVLLITDSPALILLTISSSLLLLSSLVGITGTLLNSRPILAVYVLLLFPSFISFVSVGYVTYKKANFSLDEKVSQAWNLWYSPGARMVLQGALSCCGWSGPLHGATPSGTCYARSPLPGCHGPLMRFERETLSSAAWTVFSLVPLHLANIFVGLLCANHVTHRFGKGITPARYRLSVQDVLSSVSAASATSGSGNNPPHKKTQAQVHFLFLHFWRRLAITELSERTDRPGPHTGMRV